ncbi:MAG: hypothetical protein ACREMA_03280 [Longimicrobiales bacterium]
MPLLRHDLALNWKRITGELVLIVGAVLIALAFDSWWQTRQNRQQETAYLKQLLADAQETQSRLKSSIAADSSILVSVSNVLERAFSGRVPPPDSFNLPTGYQQFRPLIGTYTALVQNGDLRPVRSDSIRFRVIAYVALIDATEVVLRHSENLIWNSTERVLNGITNHRRSSSGGGDGSAAWGPVNAKAALNDRDIVGALEVQAAASRNRLRNLHRLEEPTADLIRLLQQELRRD